MIVAAWFFAVLVMFGPGVCVTWLWWRRHSRHAALREAVAAYSHLPRRR